MWTTHNKALLIFSLALTVAPALPATFGTVVPIGGHASDIALDERRGVVYAANFAGRRVDVISTSTRTVGVPISVPSFPSTVALSSDQRYLLVGHFNSDLQDPATGAVTILDLDGSARRTVALPFPVLAAGFGGGSQALIVTAKSFFLLDPVTAALTDLGVPVTFDTGKLPVPGPKFPPEITKATLAASGDNQLLYILADAAVTAGGTGGSSGPGGAQYVVGYHVRTQELGIVGITSAPPLAPRSVSVNQDGSRLLLGWSLIDSDVTLLAQIPYPTGVLNVGSHVYDSSRNLIYGQLPVPGSTQTGGFETSPVLTVFDTDNLTVRERIQLRENLAGKSILSSDSQTMYAASDSGLMILPIGSLNQAHRVAGVQEAIVFRGNACDQRIIAGELDIVNPGGGNTSFTLSGAVNGVRLLPASGVTPAKVRIEVDPAVFQNQRGTTTVTLTLNSNSAINIPLPVRLLINTREPEQRGAFFNIPGKLVDLLADPGRDRYYVLRQDRNQVLVFDATTHVQLATLRTANTPTQMAITRDRKYLLVGHDNAQIATVYDLDRLAPEPFITFPPGHYPRSIAATNRALLAASRSVARPAAGVACPGIPHAIHKIDMATRTAVVLPSLGPYCNTINPETVLMASPGGEFAVAAAPDGLLMLYDARVDTFTASRRDVDALSGTLTALSETTFLADRHIFNWSLVREASFNTDSGITTGFGVVDGLGIRTAAASPTGPGLIERVDLLTMGAVGPTRLVEAPITVAQLKTQPIGQIGQTIPAFVRTLAPLPNRRSILTLSAAGLSAIPWEFDAAIAKPVIEDVVNLADGSNATAPGSLVTIRGQNLSPVTAVNSEIPVPTTLGEACLTVNGVLVPVLSASPNEMKAQIPFEVRAPGQMLLRSPGGTSDPFTLTLSAGAPAIFRDATAGSDTGLAAVYRAKNNQLATLANPIHPEEVIVIYLTGLGVTTPPVRSGDPSPSDPLAAAMATPEVTLGDTPLTVLFAGLTPGQVGVYQIAAEIPWWVSEGMSVPLTIRQGSVSTTVSVRVLR